MGRIDNRSLENHRWIVGPRGNRSLPAADAAFVRGSDHRWRRLRSRHRTRRRARRFSLMPMSRRVMGAPSKIAVGLWGREGTAHFRRLTPPSFAAQNPPQGAAIFIPADVPQGHGGSLENRRSDGGREGTAHFRRLTPPSFAAQNPLHCDARPQHGIVDAVGCSHRASAMENPPWQGAAIFIHADVPQGHGGSLENHLPSD